MGGETKGAWPDTRLLYGFAALLTVAAVVYLGKGYASLWFTPVLSDMSLRTVGLDYIRAGTTPYSPIRDAGWDAPWGWLGNALTYGPRPFWTRWYYGLAMFGTIALMVAWAY